MKFDPANIELPAGQVAALCEPIKDPFRPGDRVHLEDRDGVDDQVTLHLDDVIVLRNPDGRLTLSRLGVINTLLDHAAPGLRLVAHVPGPYDDPSEGPFGLSLQVIP